MNASTQNMLGRTKVLAPGFVLRSGYDWQALLVGGSEHFLFSPIVGMMIQSDELIFFRGIGIPPIRLASCICRSQNSHDQNVEEVVPKSTETLADRNGTCSSVTKNS